MPFKDSPDGQTHYQNDGCGEPAHNDMSLTPQESCKHQTIGHKSITHDGISHPTGEQLCLDCGMYFSEILANERQQVAKEALKDVNCKKCGIRDDCPLWCANCVSETLLTVMQFYNKTLNDVLSLIKSKK